MKNKVCSAVCFGFLLVFFCCNSGTSKKFSFLHTVADSLNIDRSKNVFIYTVNPNDCINCLNAFVSINNKLAAVTNSKIYIIPVEREIEKQSLRNSITTIDLKDTINNHIVWNINLFDKISKLKNINIASSMLTIYNYRMDSILFNKRIRDIEDETELEKYTGR
ncbi:MAG: hypothetical protein ACXVPU_00105 [Bacteroidia bacterium]